MKSLLDSFDWELISRDFDEKFTRFNSMRSLRGPCVLEEKRTADLVGLLDKSRPKDHYYNRVFGLCNANIDQLDDLIDWYRQAGVNCNISIAPNVASDEFLESIQAKGFRYWDSDWVFFRAASNTFSTVETTFDIQRISEANFEEFVEHLVEAGLPLDQSSVPRVASFYTASQFENYVIRLNEKMVASASVFIDGEIAWLANAQTLQTYRQQGMQLALLEYRVQRALEQSCTQVFTDAQFDSTSHRNILRAGFQLLYATSNMRLTV